MRRIINAFVEKNVKNIPYDPTVLFLDKTRQILY